MRFGRGKNPRKLQENFNCVHHQFYPNPLYFLLLTFVTRYLHDIRWYLHNLNEIYGIYMIFSKLFVICMLKAKKLLWKTRQFGAKAQTKLYSVRTWGTSFLQFWKLLHSNFGITYLKVEANTLNSGFNCINPCFPVIHYFWSKGAK